MAEKAMKSVVIGLVLLAAYIGIYSWFRICPWIQDYQRARVIECDPEDVLPFVEQALFFDFPENIEHLKIAKSKYKKMFVDFFIKFSADPNTVDRFLKSFPEEIKFEPYSQDSLSERFLPKWFNEPIIVGKRKVNIVGGEKGSLKEIYIDTTSEENFVVYLRGSYYLGLELKD
jgi:hypothetical protein